MSGPRRLLVLLLIVGSLGNLGGGTTASFTASTSNPAANFATGALVLASDVGADDASVCYSTGAGVNTDTNVNTACEQLFPVAVNKPGDEVTVLLDIANVGNLPGDLTLYAAGACTSADDPAAAYHGTGNLCDAVQLNIQEWTDDNRNVASFCRYGGGTATTCAFDTWGTATEKTLAHFTATHVNPGDDPTTPVIDMGAVAGGATRFLSVSLAIDDDVDNTYQGLKASWTLTWLLEQQA